MRVIICGAGRVGYGLASRLAVEGNTVTVVDKSADLIGKISTELDVRGVVGHGSHPDILVRAGVENADMIIAVTYTDEVNMVACQIAHSLFDVPTKVARVRAQSYLSARYNDLYSRENMPIDIIISPEVEIGKAILRRLSTPGAFNVVPFSDGRIQFLGVRVGISCPLVGQTVEQFAKRATGIDAGIVGLRRDNRVIVPKKDMELRPGDDIYFVTAAEQSGRLLDLVGTREDKARHVVIIGGGSIGTYVAAELEKQSGLRVRIIERNKETAEQAAVDLPRTVILNGDAMSADIQDEAGVHRADLVIALTDDDKTNILSAVLARKLGAKHTIVLLNDVPMQSLQKELNIDMVIDPRASTISSILRHVRRGRILDVYTLGDGGAEVLEGELLQSSPLAGKAIRDASLPSGARIGGIYREGLVIMPAPDVELQSGDRLVIFAEASVLKDVEALFRVGVELY